MERKIKLFALLFIVAASLTSRVAGGPGGIEMSEDTSVDIVKIFDFTTGSEDQINDWWGVSDTVRDPGMSKAAFTLQKSRLFQRAVFLLSSTPSPMVPALLVSKPTSAGSWTRQAKARGYWSS